MAITLIKIGTVIAGIFVVVILSRMNKNKILTSNVKKFADLRHIKPKSLRDSSLSLLVKTAIYYYNNIGAGEYRQWFWDQLTYRERGEISLRDIYFVPDRPFLNRNATDEDKSFKNTNEDIVAVIGFLVTNGIECCLTGNGNQIIDIKVLNMIPCPSFYSQLSLVLYGAKGVPTLYGGYYFKSTIFGALHFVFITDDTIIEHDKLTN